MCTAVLFAFVVVLTLLMCMNLVPRLDLSIGEILGPAIRLRLLISGSADTVLLTM